MSSKNYDQRLYVQKINLGNNNRVNLNYAPIVKTLVIALSYFLIK